MDRYRKIELVERSLGLRHKLKVHDSMKSPDTHEEMALIFLSKWELEDELQAIEELLADLRLRNVANKKSTIEREGCVFNRDHHKKSIKSK